MKKFLIIFGILSGIALLVFLVFLIPQPVDHTTTKTEVIIEDIDYVPAQTKYIPTGMRLARKEIPTQYIVEIRYDDKLYSLEDKNIYELYKDKVGKKAIAVFDTIIYDNGKCKHELLWLEAI